MKSGRKGQRPEQKNRQGQKRRGLFALLLFELLYTGVYMLFMLSVCRFAFSAAMKVSGYSYITLENLAAFLGNPTTIFLLILLGGLIFLLSFYELAALMLFFRLYYDGRRVTVFMLLLCSFAEAKRVLRERNDFGVLALSALFKLITNLPLLIGIVTQTRTLRYFAGVIFETPGVKICFAVLVAGLLLFSFFGVFSMFFCTLYGYPLKKSILKSIRLFKENLFKLLRGIVGGNLLLAGAEGLLFLLVLVILEGILFVVIPQTRLIAWMLKALDWYWLCFGVLAAAVNAVFNMALLMRLFLKYTNEKKLGAYTPEVLVASQVRMEELEEVFPKLPRRILAAFTAVILALNLFSLYLLLRNGAFLAAESFFGIQITSHRGASYDAPENTLPALELAAENLSDYAEIDVQQTKDGVVVLLHDGSLKRTTGVKQYIWNVTYEELLSFDAGGWFSAAYAGTKIPTLEEALACCKGKINLNIEIKTTRYSMDLEEKVVALIEEYDFEQQCVISSANYETLCKVKALNPDIKTGYIMSIAYGDFYEKENIDFFSIKSTFITETVVKRAHELGKEVHAWTVNTKSELERMKALNVDNIITDRALLAREVLYREEVTETLTELLNIILNKK